MPGETARLKAKRASGSAGLLVPDLANEAMSGANRREDLGESENYLSLSPQSPRQPTSLTVLFFASSFLA